MKKGKRLFAVIAVMAMMCTMITGWAANTLTIDSIDVLADDNSVAASYTYEDGVIKSNGEEASIEITAEQRLRVTVSMTDESAEKISAQTTFISYKETDPQVYDDTTIQYIDQIVTAVPTEVEGEEGYTPAAFVFRPRNTFVPGEYVVMINAEGSGAPMGFTYSVVTPTSNMTISAAPSNASFEYGKAASAVVYTVTGLNVAPTSVTLGETNITAYYNEGTIIIPVEILNTLAVGNHRLTVVAEGYNNCVLENAVVVTPTQTDVEGGDVEDVENAIGNLEMPTETDANGAMTLPESVLGGKYTVNYEIPAGTTNVTLANNKLTLAEGVPFAKVDVTASVQGVDETSTNTVYLIREGVTVGFGNLGLDVAEGKDAFAYDPAAGLSDTDKEELNTAFAQMVAGLNTTEKAHNRAIALNIALYNNADDIAALPHFADALDYNQNGNLTLAEYRIYRMMMAGGEDGVHTLTNLGDQRASFVAEAAANN